MTASQSIPSTSGKYQKVNAELISNNGNVIDSTNPLPIKIIMPIESNGGIPINIQDQTTDMIDIPFSQVTNTTTMSAGTLGDTNITVASTTGFVNGKRLAILASTRLIGVDQVGAPVGNVVTIDSPLPFNVSNGTTVLSTTINMAVDGSTTTQSFIVGPVGAIADVDITRLLGYIEDQTEMLEDLFGGRSALTYGVVFRVYDSSEGIFTNRWNVKTNGDIAILCFDATYTSGNLPTGTYGFRFRNTFAGQEKHGVVIRLEEGDYLEILIQDNLTALDKFIIMAQGHIVTD